MFSFLRFKAICKVKNIDFRGVKMPRIVKTRIFLECEQCGYATYTRPVINRIAKGGFNCPNCKDRLYVGK